MRTFLNGTLNNPPWPPASEANLNLVAGGTNRSKVVTNALPQSLAPAIAPIFLVIGGGNNYTSLFTAAAIFALLGALAIQPIKRVR